MNRDLRIAILIGGIVLGWSACFHHTRDWNTASRLLLTHSIVQNRSVEVTPFVAVDGRLADNPPTRDLASPDKVRYFCDKAPGQSFVGAAVLGVLNAIGAAEFQPSASDREASRPENLSLRRTDWLLTIATSGLAAAVSSSLVFLILRRWGADPSVAASAALALAFASPTQVYSTLFYGHTLAGMFAVASVAVFDGESSSLTKSVFSGLFAGLAVVSEYTMAVFVATMLIVGAASGVARSRYESRRLFNAVAFLLGGLGAAVLLGWYHWKVTGDPFTPAYRYEIQPDFAAVHAKGGGIPLSSLQPGAMHGLLVHPSIGLLWFAPAVVWAIPGLIGLMRSRRRTAFVTALSSLLLFFAVACFPNWNGGLATGPRFLVPMLPLLFLAVGWGWHVASQSSVGKWLLGLSAPVVAASAIFVTSTNIAGARKPFEVPTLDFIRSAELQRERNVVDWVLNPLGFNPDTPVATALLVAAGTIGTVLVIRATRY
jgi:hypothetical protein